MHIFSILGMQAWAKNLKQILIGEKELGLDRNVSHNKCSFMVI